MEPQGGIRHPLNPKALYTADEDDTVRVTMGARWGRFRKDGQWVEGSIFEADPEMCVWVAAPRPKAHHRISRLMDMPSER
jgi:hypothetical protein